MKQLNSEFSKQLKDKIQFQKEEKVSIRQAFELIFLFTTLFLSLPLLDSHTPTKHTYHCLMLPKSTTFTTIPASIYNHNFFLRASTNVWPILNHPSSLTGVPHLIYFFFLFDFVFALFWHVMMDMINVYYSTKHWHRQTQTSYTMLTQTRWHWTHMLVSDTSSVSAAWLLLGCCIKVLYEVVFGGVM